MNSKYVWKCLSAAAIVAATIGFFARHALAEKPNAATKVAPVKDQRALDELKKMGEALAGAKSMIFRASSMTPIRSPSGQWIHVFATADVKMQRPHQLFVQRGGDAFPQKIYYDGKTYSVSAPEKNLYTQTKMSGEIDSMMEQVEKTAGDAFPFADVLLSDPFTSWAKDLEGAVLVGISTRESEKLEHLALAAKDVNWEVWVDQRTHLPRMVYVKYIGEERSPSVLIEFSHWKLNTKIADSAFTFKAPKGAKMAELKAPEGMTK